MIIIKSQDWETKSNPGSYLINLLKSMKYQILTDKSLIYKYGKMLIILLIGIKMKMK